MRQPKKDDDIDLFELSEALWAGKWIVIAFLGISLVSGFTFSLYKKNSLPDPHFAVLAPYSVNLFRPLYSQNCRERFGFAPVIDNLTPIGEDNIDCVGQRMSADLENLAQSQWSKNRLIEQEWKTAGLKLNTLKPDCPGKFCLEMITRSPLDPEIYNEQLQNYNEVLTESISKEVKKELSYQFKHDANSVLASEAYAENVIKLRRLLNGIEKGQMAMNFSGTNVVEVFPPDRFNIIMMSSFFLGGFLGCALVLIRGTISSRRRKVG